MHRRQAQFRRERFGEAALRQHVSGELGAIGFVEDAALRVQHRRNPAHQQRQRQRTRVIGRVDEFAHAFRDGGAGVLGIAHLLGGDGAGLRGDGRRLAGQRRREGEISHPGGRGGRQQLGVRPAGEVIAGVAVRLERLGEAPRPHQLAELVGGVVGEGGRDHARGSVLARS